MTTVLDELADLPDRLEASVGRLRDLEKQVQLEREIRDGLIVAAVDHAGFTMAKTAKLAGVSQPHIVRILARSGD